jgi:cytochrome c
MKNLTLAAALALMSAPAFAEGDAAAGEEAFGRQCVTCHVIVDAAGVEIAGRGADTGPNLYGVIGRIPGTAADFEYGDDMVEYGGQGIAWDEATFTAYVQDPTDFLREVLDNRRARGKMAFQVRSEEEAADIYAYLVSVAPAQ